MGHRATIALCTSAILAVIGSAFAQTPPPIDPRNDVPDPGAAVGMLTDATANENGAAPAFLGLASRTSVDPLFGTATTTIPIDLPPGRKGMTPDLTIRYSSNSGNGQFGVGWDLPLGSIRRNSAKGIPLNYGGSSNGLYNDAAGFVLVFRGGTIILDSAQGNNYWSATSEETWLSAQFDPTHNSWLVTDKNGVAYSYGGSAAARTGSNVSLSTLTFAWYLTHVQDPNGNAIDISYITYDGGSGWNGHAYPNQVDYGANSAAGFAHIFHVLFGYDSTTRPDVVTSYRNGFLETASRRTTSMTVWVDGAGTSTNFTRQYTFSYTPDPDTNLSLLTGVGEAAASNSGTLPPPSTTFAYTQSARGLKTPSQTQALTFVGGTPCDPSVAGIGPGTDRGFLDVDGDGLPDFVDSYGLDSTNRCVPGVPIVPGLQVYRNRGGGQFEEDTENNGVWTNLTIDNTDAHLPWISYPSVGLIDIDGDGLLDVLATDKGNVPEAVDSLS